MRWVCDDGECVCGRALVVHRMLLTWSPRKLADGAISFGSRNDWSERHILCVRVCLCFFLSVLFRLAFAVAASARFHQINRIRQMEKKSYKLRNWMNFILFQMCLSNGQCGLGFAIWINCVWKVNTRLFVSSTLLLSPHILSIYLSTVSTHDGCCIDCECIDAFPKKIKKKIEEWNCTHHYRERGTKINCIRTQTHWKP